LLYKEFQLQEIRLVRFSKGAIFSLDIPSFLAESIDEKVDIKVLNFSEFSYKNMLTIDGPFSGSRFV